MGETPAAEYEVTVDLVEKLLADQAPALAGLPVTHADGGWDNELFRVGDRLLARLPRRAVAAELMVNELQWVPRLGADLPVETPQAVVAGEPGRGYPWPWSVVVWIDGTRAADLPLTARAHAAEMLADVLHVLHRTAPSDAPTNPFRGGSLDRPEADERFRARLAEVGDAVDVDAALPRWEAWRTAGDWDHADVWVHGDLHPLNLVIGPSGELAGVLDWGDVTAGDPAVDLATAWLTFGPRGREAFIDRLDLSGTYDDATWVRAKAWALHIAVAFMASSDDRPAMRAIGAEALAQLLEEPIP